MFVNVLSREIEICYVHTSVLINHVGFTGTDGSHGVAGSETRFYGFRQDVRAPSNNKGQALRYDPL